MHRLDPTNPQPIDVAEETLGIRNLGFSPRESLLLPAFSLVTAPQSLTVLLHCCYNAPLPLIHITSDMYKSQASVNSLAPFIFGA